MTIIKLDNVGGTAISISYSDEAGWVTLSRGELYFPLVGDELEKIAEAWLKHKQENN